MTLASKKPQGLLEQTKPVELIDAALRRGLTGHILLNCKEGRIMEVQRTEVIRV